MRSSGTEQIGERPCWWCWLAARLSICNSAEVKLADFLIANKVRYIVLNVPTHQLRKNCADLLFNVCMRECVCICILLLVYVLRPSALSIRPRSPFRGRCLVQMSSIVCRGSPPSHWTLSAMSHFSIAAPKRSTPVLRRSSLVCWPGTSVGSST